MYYAVFDCFKYLTVQCIVNFCDLCSGLNLTINCLSYLLTGYFLALKYEEAFPRGAGGGPVCFCHFPLLSACATVCIQENLAAGDKHHLPEL